MTLQHLRFPGSLECQPVAAHARVDRRAARLNSIEATLCRRKRFYRALTTGAERSLPDEAPTCHLEVAPR